MDLEDDILAIFSVFDRCCFKEKFKFFARIIENNLFS